jgi:hypothetical protein
MSETKDEIIVKEASDGSAIIDLPADLAEEEVPVQAESQDEGSDEADDAAAAAEIAEGGAVDPEAEAMRAARRAKRKARKEYHKQVSAEKDVRLQNLQRQNSELMERLSALERKQTGSDLARIDKAIEDQKMRIQYGKAKMKEAAEAGDGDLLTAAEEMVYEARRQAEALEQFKRRSVQEPQQQPIQQDPQMQRYAKEWMESHGDWYDPMGSNTDSKIALAVDQALAEEGWNPKTEEYWDELDKRLSKVLPHRYTDVAYERPQKSRPKSVVTSGGREAVSSGGKSTFTLNPDQVRAMKEAGMWDNPEKRARMIRRYAVEARKNGQRS